MRKDGRTASVSLGRPWGVPGSISRCHLILCPSYCCFVGTVHADNAIPCPCSGSRGAKSDLLPDSPNSSPAASLGVSRGRSTDLLATPLQGCRKTPRNLEPEPGDPAETLSHESIWIKE